MQAFDVVIRNWHPRNSSLDDTYNNVIEAETQQQAEQIALKSFREAQPFTIQGEVVEVYSVNGILK